MRLPASGFEFAAPERIVFGPGVASQSGALAAALGSTALLVTGRDLQRAEPVRESFRRARLNWVEFAVTQEPSVADAQAGTRQAWAAKADCVVACGGGAVVDAGKAIAALATHPGDPYRFLEIIGQGLPLENAP
jgi:alcohol dehydrogenase class IV